MSKRERGKLVALLLGMLAVMVAFWFILQRVKAGESETSVADSDFLTEEVTSGKETAEEPMGTITLGKKKYDYFHDFETYLFIGTDATGNEEADRPEDYQGSMADFLLLLILDKTDDKYGFLQLNRDTIAEVALIQKDGSGMAVADEQICTAHWYGGTKEMSCENTVEAVSKFLGGIPIDGYYSLNMDNIPKLNQAVGGVTVTLEEDFTKQDAGMKKGKTLTLTDEQAYLYVHDRYGVGDEKNVSRMVRQRQYMKSFFEAAREKMEEDSEFAVGLYKQLQESATTDVKLGRATRIAKVVQRGTGMGTKEFKGKLTEGKILGDGIDHVEFYPDVESVVSVMTELYGLRENEQ